MIYGVSIGDGNVGKRKEAFELLNASDQLPPKTTGTFDSILLQPAGCGVTE